MSPNLRITTAPTAVKLSLFTADPPSAKMLFCTHCLLSLIFAYISASNDKGSFEQLQNNDLFRNDNLTLKDTPYPAPRSALEKNRENVFSNSVENISPFVKRSESQSYQVPRQMSCYFPHIGDREEIFYSFSYITFLS